MAQPPDDEESGAPDEGVDSLVRAVAATPRISGPLQRWVGRTLGHFRLEERLGEGGMGTVYRATDLKLGRQVALKLLRSHPELGAAAAQAYAEARTAASLSHPHIASVFEVSEAEGEVYVVFERVEGPTLRRALAAPLDGARALTILRQLAEALGHAHQQGWVHGDVKPENVGLTAAGQVKLLDFGLARLASQQGGPSGGTRGYLAPELLRGEPASPRSDVYAFGKVAQEVLAACGPRTKGGLRAGLARLAAEATREAPQARPADGATLVARLQALAAPRRARAAWLAVAGALGLALAGAALLLRPPAAPRLQFHRVTSVPGGSELQIAALAPDGRSLALKDARGLSLHNLQARSSRPLASPEGMEVLAFAWLPDGERLLAAVAKGPALSLGLLRVGNSPAFTLLEEGPAWPFGVSRDGRWGAAVDPSFQVHVLALDGSARHRFELPKGSEPLGVALSPDGQRVAAAFASRAEVAAAYSVSTFAAAGGDEQRLFESAEPSGPNAWSELAWLDERRLLLARTPNTQEAGTQLWLLPVDARGRRGGEPQLVAQVPGVSARSLSAAGGAFAYLATAPQAEVYTGGADGPLTRLTEDDAEDAALGFLEDGQALFLSDRSGERALYAQGMTQGVKVPAGLQPRPFALRGEQVFWAEAPSQPPALWALRQAPLRLERLEVSAPAGAQHPACTSGTAPRCVAWLASGEKAMLLHFELLTGRRLASVELPFPARAAAGLAIDARAERAFASAAAVPHLFEVELGSGAVATRLAGCYPQSLAMAGERLLLTRVCREEGARSGVFAYAPGSEAAALLVSPDEGLHFWELVAGADGRFALTVHAYQHRAWWVDGL